MEIKTGTVRGGDDHHLYFHDIVWEWNSNEEQIIVSDDETDEELFIIEFQELLALVNGLKAVKRERDYEEKVKSINDRKDV